jgi:hypothetical protein
MIRRAPGRVSGTYGNAPQGLPTFELEVDEESDIIYALLTSCKFGEDQEPAPSLTRLCQAHTLEDSGKGLKITFSNAARSNDTERPDPSVYEKDIGDDDANCEDPLGDVEADLGPDLAGPFIEGEEINSCKSVGGVDGD